MDAKKHWDRVYETRSPTEVSWYQPDARVSLDLVTGAGHASDAVIDVGGITPDGRLQRFQYCVCDWSRPGRSRPHRRRPPSGGNVGWVY